MTVETADRHCVRGVTPEALDVLEQYGWLGKACEPRKAIERAIRGVAAIEP